MRVVTRDAILGTPWDLYHDDRNTELMTFAVGYGKAMEWVVCFRDTVEGVCTSCDAEWSEFAYRAENLEFRPDGTDADEGQIMCLNCGTEESYAEDEREAREAAREAYLESRYC